ncbi:MAG: carotenoid biosynthesis protein [Chloroflexi bacterium]|nr:carotenoid biosynthesis protein [Chloroflexota bacterium]
MIARIEAMQLRMAPAVLVAVGAWVLSMIALPIARWVAGDGVIPAMTTVSALFQVSAVLIALRATWSTTRVAATFAIVAVLTFGAEWLGSTTGVPFGDYAYTDGLQPQVAGVPLLIPVAWMMMLGPSWAVAQRVTAALPFGPLRTIAFAAISGAAMTAWDLYLDPQMVAWGFWQWAEPVGYFGIPWVNFAGWFVVSFLVTLTVRPAPVNAPPLLVIYAVVWVFQAIGMAVFWGLGGPAVFGFASMGLLLALSIRRRGRL